jgi:fibronectin type 3 domain-containing protein
MRRLAIHIVLSWPYGISTTRKLRRKKMKRVFLLVLLIVMWLFLALSLQSQAQNSKLNAKPKVTVSATGTADPSVALSCTPPAAGVKPDSYNFYRSTTSGGPYTKVGASGSCAYTDATALFATTYYYVATSVNSTTCPSGQTCESGYSNQATAVVGSNPIPNPPTGLTVGTILLSSVPLSWQENGKYTAFRVYRQPVAKTKWTTVATGIKTTSWTNVNVPKGSFNYEVRAVNNVKGTVYLSNPSNVVTATVQ